jgi:hypothetical protein
LLRKDHEPSPFGFVPPEHLSDRFCESGNIPTTNEVELRGRVLANGRESHGNPSNKEKGTLEREQSDEFDQLLERRHLEPELRLVQRTGELVCRNRERIDDRHRRWLAPQLWRDPRLRLFISGSRHPVGDAARDEQARR